MFTHLIDAGQDREKRAVESLVSLACAPPVSSWLNSLGIDPRAHWALLRPTFNDVHPEFNHPDVDIVLGNVDSSGCSFSVDHLVAVEAKAWAVSKEDLEPWRQGPSPRSKLWKQVRRNREWGFSRIAGIDIVCCEAEDAYVEAQIGADRGGRWKGQTAQLADEELRELPAGYALFSYGGVSWKPEEDSGTLGMIECREAPCLPSGSEQLKRVVGRLLDQCSRVFGPPFHYIQEDGIWRPFPA